MSHLRKLKAREDNFNLSGLSHFKRPEYNALFDPNMRHYFENAKTQKHLYRSGLIDTHGRVIDYDKNKSKVAILEKEFLEAEKIEERRRKEEMEMRVRMGEYALCMCMSLAGEAFLSNKTADGMIPVSFDLPRIQ
jgi:hypothetical protein